MRVFGRLVALVALVGAASAPIGRPAKRSNTWYEPVVSAAVRLVETATELLAIKRPAHVYHSDEPGARIQLIDDLWSSAWMDGVADKFTASNPALTALLKAQRVDGADPTQFRDVQGQGRWEPVWSAIFRARSQKWVSADTAAISAMWLYFRVPQPVWDTMVYFSGAVMSRTWTE